MIKPYRSWAEIDLSAVQLNVAFLASLVPKGVKVVGVVKADAYGHGLTQIALALEPFVNQLAVACVEEALTLREAGVKSPILVLGPALPEERPIMVGNGFIASVSTADEALSFARSVPEGPAFPIHLVVDTGMGRIGLWGSQVDATLAAIKSSPRLKVLAISTHLPVADDDADYTAEQISRFRHDARRLFPMGICHSVLSSAGVLRFGQQAQEGDFVRLGLCLYGISPIPEFRDRVHPALTWKTRVSLVRSLGPGRSISYGRTFVTERETKVATLATGYGDGYPRHLSGKNAHVLIGGHRCAVLGRITMDQMMVDVSNRCQVSPGEEAVLIGPQGTEEISATELASKAGTIPWEILTRISKRVTRLYFSSGSRVKTNM